MKVTHDFHIHTYLSLCAPDKTGTVENYVESAKKHGLKKIGFANHFWGSNSGDPEYYKNVRMNPYDYYLTQNYEYISQIRPEIKAVDCGDIKLYFGCEAEYDPFKRGIAVTPEQAEELDFIIVPNSHTHMMMQKSLYEPYEKHIEFMFQAFYDIVNCDLSKYVTAIAHPFQAVASPYDRNILNKLITDDRYKKAFDAAAQKGIAIEINVFPLSAGSENAVEKLEEDIRMFLLAKECGCKFIFGSDAHIISEHKYFSDADKISDILGLTEEDIAEKAR